MSRLAELLGEFDLPEGFSESRLKGVQFMKSLQHIPRAPLLYESGIYIIAQGNKFGYLDDHIFRYDANNYLVVSVTMPFECETFATPETPLLGLYINVDMLQLHDLISQLGHSSECEEKKATLPRGIGPAPLEQGINDAAIRLLDCLRSETKTNVLGTCIVREILFHALCGTQAPVLYALASHNGNFARIARAIKLIHRDYATKIDVDQLAGQANMSASTFHRFFKEITSDSPMQYLKKIRLNKARNHMIQERMKAYIAADKVGYESNSQFSREFKRYFNQSPTDLIRELRNSTE